jgi:hypothetical protein
MVPSCITDQSIFILMLFSLIEIIMQVWKITDILMLLMLLQETV